MERFEETLHEKQVIVLGGSSGIGLETARLAGAQGAKLVLVARTAPSPCEDQRAIT